MLFIASDHGGFKLKNEIITYLSRLGVKIIDMGPKDYAPEDDYPDYVVPTVRKVQEDPKAMAILICKNGVGVSMLANKFRDIRCTLSWT